MEYIYTINIYSNDKKSHSEQLISLGNYKSLNKLLVGEDDIKPGEYVIDNGKMILSVIDNILIEKYLKEEPQEITVKNSRGNDVVKIYHPFTDVSTLFMNSLFKALEQNELSENGKVLIFSKIIKELVYTHDLFTTIVLSDLFATLDCIDCITGDVKKGFKLTVEVEEDEQD